MTHSSILAWEIPWITTVQGIAESDTTEHTHNIKLDKMVGLLKIWIRLFFVHFQYLKMQLYIVVTKYITETIISVKCYLFDFHEPCLRHHEQR